MNALDENKVAVLDQDPQSTPLESDAYHAKSAPPAKPSSWLKVGAIAAGSALAGGLLAAWWYRKTLDTLREAEANGQNPQFGNSSDKTDDEE